MARWTTIPARRGARFLGNSRNVPGVGRNGAYGAPEVPRRQANVAGNVEIVVGRAANVAGRPRIVTSSPRIVTRRAAKVT